jgi:hypothetical protein
MKRFVVALAAVMLGTGAMTRAASRSDVADAVMTGDRAALRALIQQKADVSAPQIDGATALHWAVYRDDLESADLLIAAGAKVDAANREASLRAIMVAIYGNAAMIAPEGARDEATSPQWRDHGHAGRTQRNPQAIKLLSVAARM